VCSGKDREMLEPLCKEEWGKDKTPKQRERKLGMQLERARRFDVPIPSWKSGSPTSSNLLVVPWGATPSWGSAQPVLGKELARARPGVF
jgi:hypothetical protein